MHCVNHVIDYDCDSDCPVCKAEARVTELEAENANLKRILLDKAVRVEAEIEALRKIVSS